VEVLPDILCKLVTNEALEKKAVNAICTAQKKVPAAECEAVLTKVWDEISKKECSSIDARVFVSGVTSEAMAARAHFAKTTEMKLSSVAIPDDFDSETNWPECAKVIGDIRDQSNCGCCWAFAAASAASDRLCIATKAKVIAPLSANDVCFCASEDGCGGGDITSPWNFIQKGAVTGGQFNGTGPFGGGYCNDWSFPHCHHHGPVGTDPYPAEGQPGCPSQKSPQCPSKCDSGAEGAHKEFAADKWGFEGQILQISGADNIAQTIMKGGPVETAFTVFADFANYSSGIYEHKTGAKLGGHAVRIVGFGTENSVKYWKVANSWNPYWGEKGYFRIIRGTNNCGIEDMVTASAPDAIWSQKGSSTVVV